MTSDAVIVDQMVQEITKRPEDPPRHGMRSYPGYPGIEGGSGGA